MYVQFLFDGDVSDSDYSEIPFRVLISDDGCMLFAVFSEPRSLHTVRSLIGRKLNLVQIKDS